MRSIIILLSAFLLLFTTSCEEDSPRVNVGVFVQFNVQTTLGEPFPGVRVFLEANKYNLASGKATGTAFSHTVTTGASGVVEWSGVTYNINSEEVIRVDAFGTIDVIDETYTGETTLYYNSGDAPGFLKTQVLTINF